MEDNRNVMESSLILFIILGIDFQGHSSQPYSTSLGFNIWFKSVKIVKLRCFDVFWFFFIFYFS